MKVFWEMSQFCVHMEINGSLHKEESHLDLEWYEGEKMMEEYTF